MDKVYLTPEEKEIIQDLQTSESELITRIGELEINIELLKIKKSEELSKISDLNKRKTQLGKELQDKYGEGSINLETGEFIKTI